MKKKRRYPKIFVAKGYGKGMYAVYQQNSPAYGDLKQLSGDMSQLAAYRTALAMVNGELAIPEVGIQS